MDFRQLQYVLKVAECGSITRAATELYMAQPSLSNYIGKVEKELGVLLFDRSVNPIQLTLAGEEYVKEAKRILYIQEQLQKKLQDISQVSRRRVRIGISHERGIFMLPRILPVFRERFPEVSVEVVPGSHKKLSALLSEGMLDIVMLPTIEKTADFRYIDVYEEEIMVCAGAGIVRSEHLYEGKWDMIDPDRCGSIPFIKMEPGHVITHAFDRVFTGKMNIVFEAYSSAEALRLAAAGMGACLVSQMTMDMIQYDHATRAFSIGPKPMTWSVCACMRKDAYVGSVEKALIQIAQDSMSRYTERIREKLNSLSE